MCRIVNQNYCLCLLCCSVLQLDALADMPMGDRWLQTTSTSDVLYRRWWRVHLWALFYCWGWALALATTTCAQAITVIAQKLIGLL